MYRNLILVIIVSVLILISSQSASAAQIKLAWDPNTESDLAGYKVYYGTISKTYVSSIDVGNITTLALTGLTQGQTYFMAVTAYDALHDESGYSIEVSGIAGDAPTPTPQFFLFFDDFSTDKGWTGYEPGGWKRGPAVAGGGENGIPDPRTDHSNKGDNYILGFAIGADYPNNLLIEKEIISPPINCTGQSQIFLKFWRYLNVESNYYDHAKVYVSNGRTNWVQLWENPVFDLLDNQWIQVVYDISSVAANQATVYVKFTMGPTNASVRYSGWNIDDLEVTSNYAGPLALYVPSDNSPDPNIDEMLIQKGLGIKHFNEIPTDLSDYNLLIVSKNEACNSYTANCIKNFVQNGGGAIIMNSIPKFLAGNTNDLSSIRDWFGAGTYGNDCGCAIVSIPNPFGTDLLVDDTLDYTPMDTCQGASVYNLNADSTTISAWNGGGTHSFIHSFGQGRVFYYAANPGYCEDPNPKIKENSLDLFDAGLMWAANYVSADVPNSYWAEGYINAIYNAHIMVDCSQKALKYCPEEDVTREQMAAFIVRALKSEPPLNYCDSGSLFTDVTPDMWSCRYIKRLKELGITKGYGDVRYGPYDFVTREQVAAFIVRAVEGEPPLNYCDSGSLFSDVTSDMWSCRYIKRLKELAITTGYGDGRYGPYDLVTRAQMAAFLSRAFLGME